MTAVRVECKKFVVLVIVENHVIVDAAPMVRKFIGQPLGNLLRWAERFGGYKYSTL